MPEYTFCDTYTTYYTVDAENEEQAQKLADSVSHTDSLEFFDTQLVAIDDVEIAPERHQLSIV